MRLQLEFGDLVKRILPGGLLLRLLLALFTLVPLAAPMPADPVWICGIYDEADGDAAVLMAKSRVRRFEEQLLVLSPALIVESVLLAASPLIPVASVCSIQARAPPSSWIPPKSRQLV